MRCKSIESPDNVQSLMNTQESQCVCHGIVTGAADDAAHHFSQHRLPQLDDSAVKAIESIALFGLCFQKNASNWLECFQSTPCGLAQQKVHDQITQHFTVLCLEGGLVQVSQRLEPDGFQ